MRIVIVEDEAPIREGMEKILQKLNPSYVLAGKAADGLEGLEVIRKEKPDVILMDIRMPVMDGLEASRLIRALERPDARSVPIVAMSANAFEEDMKKSMESGMNAHLAKPFQVEELVDTLNRIIAGSR